MPEIRSETPWTDEELDRALEHLLAKSQVHANSLGRVVTMIDPTSAVGAGPAGRRRTGLLMAAVVVAVAVAVGVPLAVFRPTVAPATAGTRTPLSVEACNRHNLTTGEVAPTPAPTVAAPVGSPATTWYSAARAAQLSMALRAALPAGTCVFRRSAWGDLTFPAQLNPGDAGVAPHVGELDAQAAGRLVTTAGDGNLMMSIFSAVDASRCIADRFDRMLTDKDGTVIWQLTTSAASPTTKWAVLIVTAYRTNGTCTMLRLADERAGADDTPSRPGMTATGALPLSMAQLTTLVAAPGLTIRPTAGTDSATTPFTITPEAGRTDVSYPAAERRAMPTLSGPDLTGKTLRLSDYRGKVVVINFWGSWCAPCRAEAVQLRSASASLAAGGVRFLGIDVKDSTANARAFDSAENIPYPSVFDPKSQVWQAISGSKLSALPVTIVLDKQHRVSQVWTRAVTRADLTVVVDRLVHEIE